MLRHRLRPALSFLNLYSHFLSMGAHLSSPKTDKVSCCGGDFTVHTTRYGASSMQGWRVSMEDAHLALPNLYQQSSHGDGGSTTAVAENAGKTKSGLDNTLVGVYGVFDGHGGSCVSQWVSENFADLLKNEIEHYSELKHSKKISLKSLDMISETQAVVAESLQAAFLKVDEELQRPETDQVLRRINEKVRSDNPSQSLVDGSSLFKVLLPDRAPNRQQTIRLIEQHTERLLRESFNFHNMNQSNINASDDLTKYSEDGDGPNKLSEDENAEIEDVDMLGSKEATSDDRDAIGLDNVDDENGHHRERVESLVMRSIPDDEPLKSPDCIGKDDYDMEGDILEDGPNLAFGCGSTSVVMVVLGGESPSILVANAGDSRAVLCRGGQAIALSHDHKPQLREEGERIRRAGGCVTNGRVDGNLNLSRSLGDLAFKRDRTLPPAEQRISAMPDVRICPLTPNDEFVVLACDGIWDCKSNQEVIDFVRTRLEDADDSSKDGSDSESTVGERSDRLAKICEELCDDCLSNNPSESEGIGCDNMTVIIVQLNKRLVESSGTATAKPIALYGKQVDAYL